VLTLDDADSKHTYPLDREEQPARKSFAHTLTLPIAVVTTDKFPARRRR
jgi:hypothetical protein